MEIYRPEDAFGMNLLTFKLFGVWPSAVKHPVLRFVYKMYGYAFQIFYVTSTFPAQLINLYLTRGDLQKLVDNSFFTLTCTGYLTKLVVFLIRRKKIEEFFERLHQPIFAPKRKEDLMVLKDSTIIAKASSMTFMVLSMITCATWILFPLVDSGQEKMLLFSAWYPYNVSENPNYGYTYATQTLLLLTTASMDSMIDMMTTNFYVVMVGQLEILKKDFQRLVDDVVVNNLSDASREFSEWTSNIYEKLDSDQGNGTSDLTSSYKDTFCCKEDRLEKILNERVAKCTIHYEAILDFVNDVTDLFQIGIVVQVCASSIIICVTCFEMTMISPVTLQFHVMMQYQVCMLFQIFIYTWRGNEITLKTAELKDAVYECAWTSVPSTKFRKSLCIIMSRLQVPVKLCVGNFFLLSVDTFFKILRLAYSFYILLQRVHAKKE